MTLQGETAFITGASRGIGAAIALELGRLGATVVGTSTSDQGAEHLSAELRSAGVSGQGCVLDVTDGAAVDALCREVEQRWGTPFIVVNNAGITRDGLLLRMNEDDWDVLIDTNLKSVYRVCRAWLKSMVKLRRGRIINVSSLAGVIGNPGQTNYAAAKAGVLGFTKALAREVAPRGITVNAVAPGFIETDMTRAFGAEQRQALVDMIPLKRFGSAADVAGAVAFLASPAAAYITGTTLHVNGGLYMA